MIQFGNVQLWSAHCFLQLYRKQCDRFWIKLKIIIRILSFKNISLAISRSVLISFDKTMNIITSCTLIKIDISTNNLYYLPQSIQSPALHGILHDMMRRISLVLVKEMKDSKKWMMNSKLPSWQFLLGMMKFQVQERKMLQNSSRYLNLIRGSKITWWR